MNGVVFPCKIYGFLELAEARNLINCSAHSQHLATNFFRPDAIQVI